MSALVGRAPVLERLERELASAGGAFVAGPPGSGVTACLRAFAERCRAAGVPVNYAVGTYDAAGEQAAAMTVLDDAHLLVEVQAVALRDAVLNRRARVVAGSTRADACVGPLTWLWLSGTLARVDLAPLGAESVAQLIEETVGAPPDGATTRTFFADSAGIPALLVSTVAEAVSTAALVARTGLARQTGPLAITEDLRARVRSMRAMLDDDADRAFAVICAADSLSIPDDAVPAPILSRLVDQQLVRVEPNGSRAVVRPVAGAVARVVRDDLGHLGRVDTARSLLASTTDAAPAVRTRWRVLAGIEVDVGDLLDAARACRAAGELVDAEHFAQRAWLADDALGGFLLAEVLAAQGRRRDAATLLERMLARDDIDPVVRAACAFEFTTLLLWNLDEPARAIALARETAAASSAFLGAARACGALGSVVLYAGRPAEALDVLGPFLADPTSYDEPLVDHVVSVARTLTGECAVGATDALRGLARCLDSSTGAPDADPEIHVVSSTLALGEAGRLDEADALAREWYERALQRGIHVGWVALSCARVALHRGDVRAADRFAREAAADFADLDNLAPRRWAMAAQLLAAAVAGRAEECIRLDRSLDELGPSAVRFLEPDIERARAWGVSAAGHLSEARRELCSTALRAEQSGAPVLAATAWHDAVRLGAREATAELIRLREVVDSEWAHVRAAHADAFERDDANGLLAAAHDFAAMGASLCACDASAQAVIVLRRKGGRHDAREAMARCNEYRSACGPVATPALRELGAVQLSPREREVAQLAASGYTSREVAVRLSISVRTVDNLLQRAYTKLGVRQRDELVAALEHA